MGYRTAGLLPALRQELGIVVTRENVPMRVIRRRLARV